MKQKVSICIPVYNGGQLLRRAIESALTQTHPTVEVVIVDNASTDETPTLVAEYEAKDSRVKSFRNEKNIGNNPNILRSFQLATGDFVQLLCHDDWLSPTYIADVYRLFELHPESLFCTGKVVGFLSDEGFSITECNYQNYFTREKYSISDILGKLYSSIWLHYTILGMMRKDDVDKAIANMPDAVYQQNFSSTDTNGYLRQIFSDAFLILVIQSLFSYRWIGATNSCFYAKVGTTVTKERVERIYPRNTIQQVVEYQTMIAEHYSKLYSTLGFLKYLPAMKYYFSRTLLNELVIHCLKTKTSLRALLQHKNVRDYLASIPRVRLLAEIIRCLPWLVLRGLAYNARGQRKKRFTSFCVPLTPL